MRARTAAAAAFSLAAAVLVPSPLAAQAPPKVPAPSSSAQVVVSADKVPEDLLDVAAAVDVVQGEDLRRRGARTLQDVLQDVVGVEAAGGSDGGPRFPNVGVWGLKEFDALLVTVDGLPVGGPFHPSLAQVPIEEIERIEILKGPQGTLYGVSAFAGAVNVFTRRGKRTELALGLGSWNDRHASASYETRDRDRFLRVSGSMFRDHGFQDATDSSVDRLSVSYGSQTRGSSWEVTAGILRDTAYWGSPLPIADGELVPGFELDRNYAVRGARMDHRVYTLVSNVSRTLAPGVVLQNTLGLTRDEQIAVRSFLDGVEGSTATASGTSLRPVTSTAFDDLRVVATEGAHRLVLGAATTWGRTAASGTGFDFELTTGPSPIVPSVDDLPAGDNRSAEDRRTFWGLYLNDTWTPWPWLSLTLGARYDHTSESLTADVREVGAPEAAHAEDSRTDGKWSGGVSALFRAVKAPGAGFLNAVHVWVAARTNFRPAAPNLLQGGPARILEPERSRSGEVGLRSRFLGGSLSLDASLFHMTLENVAVSTPGPDGQPTLTNAGEQRFQGFEGRFTWTPKDLESLALSAGYAHHDATYVSFSFRTPDGELLAVDGQRVALVPRDLWNARIAWAPRHGPGAWAAVRHQGIRPVTPGNTAYAPSFTEWDAGLSWEIDWLRVSLTGRNLGDERSVTAESDLGDAQFYWSPPRRVVGEVAVRF